MSPHNLYRTIYFADCANVLPELADEDYELIYIDPPFNTGKTQKMTRTSKNEVVSEMAYSDSCDDYLAFLGPLLEQAKRLLAANGSLFVHLDYREIHYIKVFLDKLFGRKSFMNEIIWAYDYGGRSETKWPTKHDNILWYAKNPQDYVFNFNEMDRIPYMAPGLVGKKKAERGKTPTDVWWHTIVPTNGRERTGYPTQKPLGIVRRIVQVHSRPGDNVMDFFAGSGTTGEAAARLGRGFVLVDSNEEAIAVMEKRLEFIRPKIVKGWQ